MMVHSMMPRGGCTVRCCAGRPPRRPAGGRAGGMDTAQRLAFGTLLRRHRLAAGLTQEELAERAYISRRSVSDMERGVPHRPRPETVALLAAALALSESDHSAFVEAAGQLRAAPSPSATRPHP